jgi:hypothetical protein
MVCHELILQFPPIGLVVIIREKPDDDVGSRRIEVGWNILTAKNGKGVFLCFPAVEKVKGIVIGFGVEF